MTTFKVFEQIGEITITGIRTAEENSMIAAEVREKEKREKEERERKERIEREEREKRARIEREEREKREKGEAMEFLVKKLIPIINEKAERGGQFIGLHWHEEKIKTEACGISYYSYCSYFKYFAEILRSMGYKVDPVHEYSQSWRTRSGKIGYAYIWW